MSGLVRKVASGSGLIRSRLLSSNAPSVLSHGCTASFVLHSRKVIRSFYSTKPSASISEDDEDSHDDFKPKFKSTGAAKLPDASEGSVLDLIEHDISNNRVFLYMKGYPNAPQCGFSAQVVHILNKSGVEFKSRNVLEDAELREGVKKFSNWPTIPQLYVEGEFIGGCDIVTSLFQSGELAEILGEPEKK
jgi:monothiol glutaredoxin